MFFYSGASGDLTGLLFVGPIVAVLLGMSIYTDVSYDSTAFSLHLQTGVSGRDDRWGRVLAVSVFAIPVTIFLTVASVWFSDAWERLAGLLGISLGLLLTGLTLSSLISGRFAFSVPAPGDNPFTSRPGLLIIGVRWGGKLMDKRGPELLVQLQRQK